MLNKMKILIKKIPNLNLVIMLEYQNTKTFWLKDILQIGSEEVFVVSKIKNTVPWTYVISDLNGELIAGTFYEKELQKSSQKECRIEKVIKKRMINCTLNGKDMIIHLIVGLIKKTLYKSESILS